MSDAAIQIVDYDPRWRADFARLNVEWLERWFVVEDVDREVLGDPESHILAHEHSAAVGIDPLNAAQQEIWPAVL